MLLHAIEGSTKIDEVPEALYPMFSSYKITLCNRASDFFQDWWDEVTHGAKKLVAHFLK